MDDAYDPEKTLEAYGYRKPSHGKTVVIILLFILLIAAGAAAGFLGKLWSEEQSKTLAFEQEIKSFSEIISGLESKNAELSSLLADKQAETERLSHEWTTQVEALKKEHAEQLQRTYAHMNEIIYDSRSTLSYIGDIESRLRAGQRIDRADAAKLTGIINGLAFLHQEYKKPLNEFRELDSYFTRQLSAIPDNQPDPRETASIGRKLFKNKAFKEERDTYVENQGRRSALIEAKNTVAAAYASAQRQMAALALDTNKYLAQLQNIVDSNEASANEVDEFFAKSKEILKIHEKIMNVDGPKPQEIKP